MNISCKEPAMNRKELIKLCKERKIKYITRMSKQDMIEVLKLNDQDKSIDCHPNTRRKVLEYKKEYRENNYLDHLLKLCKERNIKYLTRMSKQEMIEVLEWNDQDKSIDCHPNTRRKVLEYTKGYRENNPDQREKQKERSRKWRINNPEKSKRKTCASEKNSQE